MAIRGRDVAMVLVGVAATETVGHWWLGTMGRDMMPIKFGNLWTVTPEFNLLLMIAWPVALAVLVWLAWFRRQSPRRQ